MPSPDVSAWFTARPRDDAATRTAVDTVQSILASTAHELELRLKGGETEARERALLHLKEAALWSRRALEFAGR
jgi:hypothetical protein